MSMDRLFFDLCLLVIFEKLAPTNSTKVNRIHFPATKSPLYAPALFLG